MSNVTYIQYLSENVSLSALAIDMLKQCRFCIGLKGGDFFVGQISLLSLLNEFDFIDLFLELTSLFPMILPSQKCDKLFSPCTNSFLY